MAAHPRSPFQTSSSSSSPRNTSRMTTSRPQLPLMSEVNGSRNSSFRSKTSAASGSCHSAKLHLSTRSMGSASRRSDANMALSKKAQLENDAMVYLDGPQVYTCGQCRTHLTSHDDIISKSFHGRKGRAYLFDQCVNVVLSQPEDRVLITGLHTVCDISCKRCQTLIGWTYARAYEPSQKYKEGKFIIEKINLHLEEADGYQVERPAGERGDKWRLRTSSWGSERGSGSFDEGEGRCGFLATSPGRSGGSSTYFGGTSSPTSGLLRSYSSQYHRSPKNPNRQQSSSSGLVHMSPGSPGRIIYEYREEDD